MDEKEYIPLEEEDIKGIDDIDEEDLVDIASYTLEDLVDEVLILLGCADKRSTYSDGNYKIIEAEHDGNKIIINTGAQTAILQLESWSKYFPLRVKVAKSGRRYYFTKT